MGGIGTRQNGIYNPASLKLKVSAYTGTSGSYKVRMVGLLTRHTGRYWLAAATGATFAVPVIPFPCNAVRIVDENNTTVPGFYRSLRVLAGVVCCAAAARYAREMPLASFCRVG